MTVPSAYKVPQSAARAFTDGPEQCLEYVRNDALWFGTSRVSPGQTGGTDPGHPVSWEIFYCVQGTAKIDLGGTSHQVVGGDALAIPPGVPHTITNEGTDDVIIAWAGAPGVQAPVAV